MEYNREYLINKYNATSTDDGNGDIESYERWLEDQLCARLRVIDRFALPTDSETEKWFDENIGSKNECSASSAIYKFRMWLGDRNLSSIIHFDPYKK